MHARTRILLLLCIHIGVYFRACTKEQADKLGLVGWVKNTPEGTVVGQAEGSSDKINAMKEWLSKVGSPQSEILDAKFKESPVDRPSFNSFTVIKKGNNKST